MSNTQTFPLSAEEIESTRQHLLRLPRGFLPLPIFLEIARHIPMSIVEIVPLREREGRVEVLLLERPEDDVYWAGLLHTPGTVVRSTDRMGSYQDAFDRILIDELASVEVAGEPQFVRTVLHESRRGVEDAKIYYVEVSGEPTRGSFYDVDQLPSNLVPMNDELIKIAVEAFARNK